MVIKNYYEETERQIIARYKGENDNYCVTTTLMLADFDYCEIITVVDDIFNKKESRVENSGVVCSDIREEPIEVNKSLFMKHVCRLQKQYGVYMLVNA